MKIDPEVYKLLKRVATYYAESEVLGESEEIELDELEKFLIIIKSHPDLEAELEQTIQSIKEDLENA